ncbi:MAG: hypothetical protein KTR27_22105 [Leptolyngbyaceae cyanobacterium MAG.088]|nr:hypothetical protein [Leptolyngbyaceae cyanobacterium MAG.088]
MLTGMGKQLKFWFLATLTTLMVLAGSILQLGEPLIAAQTKPAIEIANQLYIQYPDIPRATVANTSLLSRFIDYHLDTQIRPAQYHLDWELSMADYLDASYNTKVKHLDVSRTDKQAMQTLTIQQRHDIVRTLEKHFTQ